MIKVAEIDIGSGNHPVSFPCVDGLDGILIVAASCLYFHKDHHVPFLGDYVYLDIPESQIPFTHHIS